MAEDFSKRAAVGQAYNLAYADARKNDRETDKEYIIKRFKYHMQFAALLQNASIDQLAKITETEEVLELFKAIDKHLES